MATMNPLDSEGTYALPIAQMDRFLMKVNVGYPSRDEELRILDRFAVADTQPVRAVATLDDVRAWRDAGARRAHRREAQTLHRRARRDHARGRAACACATPSGATLRAAELIDYGASPRATLALAFLARGRALLDGRDFALPDDVRAVARARAAPSHRFQLPPRRRGRQRRPRRSRR